MISTQPESSFPPINNSPDEVENGGKTHSRTKSFLQSISHDITTEGETFLNNNNPSGSESPRTQMNCCEEATTFCIRIVD